MNERNHLNVLNTLYKKSLSFRGKILYLPLGIVFLAIVTITGISSYFTKEAMLNNMKTHGFHIAQQFIGRLKSNEAAEDVLNDMIEDRIRAVCNIVIKNKGILSNDYLNELSEDFDIDEIYWFDKDGEIIYATVPGYLGWRPDSNHPLSTIMQGQSELMEDIRKDAEFGNYVKYGAVRSADGTFVQAGISADKIYELTNQFSYQTIVEDMASNEDISYIHVVDNNNVVIACSNPEDIGMQKSIENFISVVQNRAPHASEYYSASLGESIYDVVYPIIIDENFIGFVNIGYKMEDAQAAISGIIRLILVVAAVVFAALILILNRISDGVIKSIENIKNQLGIMAAGNFDNEVPESLINKKDEFGDIAKSLNTTQKSIKNIITDHQMLVEKMQFGLAVHEIITDEKGTPVDYRFLSANSSFEKLTGLKPEEIVGKRALEVLPHLEPYWLNTYGEVALTGDSQEFENYADELGRWYQVVAYSPGNNQFAVIIDDISNRKRMEELLYMEKENFRTTLLSIGDGVISTDNKGKIILMNVIAEQLTGWKEEEAIGSDFAEVFTIVHEYTMEPCRNLVEDVLRTGEIKELANHTALIRRNGTLLPIEDSAAPIWSKNGKITGVVIVFRDFTEKREKHNQIEYLSYHDYLTGLYNRRYMEEAMKRMDTVENLPVSIMVLDINGLKLTNDAFGHEMGDKLLKKVAGILKKTCRPQDVIARMGGDEFSILMPNTNSEQALNIRDSIIKETSKIELESVIVSIAAGYDIKTDTSQDIDVIIKNAENSMYEGKMKYGRAMRSQVIENVLRSINLKYDNEQIHTERVAEYCELMAREMNFSEREIYTIKHAGILHDIGKIIIPPELLNKKETLTNDEFDIIKKHSETGYHILRNTYEYAGLAKIVRHHHEMFDGNGYPDKLKGHEIPLESRIIAIADAYEAMTANRPYQVAKSKEEALLEIKRCSGTQFDPEIAEIFLKIM
ncbi:diguanylate cyclase [Sedimentibacter hydroxybenzoicus DSM 7310]|uniref:Diguanylate cyclase n=1 Tax=Sedimentibacter hydroxybenzoicus DSM 7310 TaxID=1123245 RepID=A0A974BHN2_SEDHY|nr:HD domain-containing phosphohydrolase [Sedimentibacter hydroxybenzoicus]NYB72860.1 diguanylate cyclase [Sedimentibacter hydroxybenzoicus DSM 7310]